MTSQDKYLLLSGKPESQLVELSYSFLMSECKQAGNTKNMLGEAFDCNAVFSCCLYMSYSQD